MQEQQQHPSFNAVSPPQGPTLSPAVGGSGEALGQKAELIAAKLDFWLFYRDLVRKYGASTAMDALVSEMERVR